MSTSKIITKEMFFNELKTSAIIGSINLASIKTSYLIELCVAICKVKKWNVKMFDFDFNEFKIYPRLWVSQLRVYRISGS